MQCRGIAAVSALTNTQVVGTSLDVLYRGHCILRSNFNEAEMWGAKPSRIYSMCSVPCLDMQQFSRVQLHSPLKTIFWLCVMLCVCVFHVKTW